MSTVAGSLFSEQFQLGTGFPQLVTGTSPAAGANFTYSLDSKWVQRLISIRFLLTTDANAANRIVTVNYLDPSGNTYLTNGPVNFLPASATNIVYEGTMYRQDSDFNSSGSDYSTTYFGLAPIFLYNTPSLTITVGNIQVGDQLSSIRMYFERWDSEPHWIYAGPHQPPLYGTV